MRKKANPNRTRTVGQANPNRTRTVPHANANRTRTPKTRVHPPSKHDNEVSLYNTRIWKDTFKKYLNTDTRYISKKYLRYRYRYKCKIVSKYKILYFVFKIQDTKIT